MTTPLLGGVLIGIAVSLMLYFNGRVTGVSGIINGLLGPVGGDAAWRVAFVAGLAAGGALLMAFKPEVFGSRDLSSGWPVIVSGLLVGFGTVLGSGCTSGHGVCGVSRLSLRSIAATLIFIFAGVATVFVLRQLVSLP